MTVLLVLMTFLAFALLDYALHRRKAAKQVESEAPVRAAEPVSAHHIGGFLVPEELRYHQGHAWLRRERPNHVRIGLDEFAAKVAGVVDRIELPKPGQWIRQGQAAWKLVRSGEKTAMVSPIEGEVLEVNSEVLKDPSLARKEPYGRGWLLCVHVPDEETTARNLVPPHMIRTWMQNAVERLYARQPELAGAVAADGGIPAEDLWTALSHGAAPKGTWGEFTKEFFLP